MSAPKHEPRLRLPPILELARARLRQGHRTLKYPKAEVKLPERFRGRPQLAPARCPEGCRACADACPVGAVGVAARASGRTRDVRKDHPSGVYRFAHVPVARAEAGDVLSRAQVRRLEITRSITFVREQVMRLPDGKLWAPLPPARPDALAVALVEGWRGEIVHAAATGSDGALSAYKVVDPSFHNWFALAVAMRGNAISDFPLVNKSFNLSYAGHDL